MGDIADALVEKAGKENVDTAEISSSLKRYLELKGYTPKPDFLEMTGQYDRIVMNPPFEKFQDIDHVRKAYDMLKPGGKLVAIMGEGSFFRTDKKAQEFRDWLDETGGTNEKLESGAFTGKEAFRQTGVASRIVEIEKPKQPTENRTKPEIVKEYISALDTMESRRKARDYSDWNKLNEQTNALLSEAYGQGFDLQEAAKNEAPSRDIKDIKKDIADTEKRLDALRKGIKIPGVDEGATRANTTTYNANAGNLAKMRDAYRDELKRAEEKEQAPAAEKSLPEGVSPIEVKRMEDEVSRIRNKVSSLETRMESLNKASEGIPGSFVTGRSNYPKSLANMREGMNNKLSDNFSELQKERENLKYKENLLNSYRAGEVHPNGQPRANAPSREASKKAEATWSDFIRATVKPGDRVTFTQNPIPEGNEVSRVNKKTVTFKGGTAWDHIEILPWKDGKPLTQKESIAEFRAWREKQVQPEPVSKKPVASKATGIDRDPTWKPKFHKSTGDIILHPKAITPEVMPATWAIEGTRVGKYYDQLGMRGDKSDTTVGAYGILETKSGKTNYDSVHADWTQRYQEATGMPVTDKDFDSVYEQAKQEITQYQDGRIFRDTTGKFHRSDTQQFTPEELKNKQEDWRDGLRKEGFTDEDISDLESRTATEDDIRYAIRKAKADADEEIGNLYPDEADEAIREVDKEDKVAPVAPIPKSAKNPDATIGLFDLTDSATGETIPAGTPHYILNDGRIFSEDSYSKLIDVGAQENLFSHGEVKAEKTGKELWKMNPDEFARNVKHTVSEDGKTVTVELPDGKTLSFDRTPGVDIYNHAHELIVEEAAKANKPIPDHVLRSHPQLFAKYGKKPSESAPVEDKQASMLNGEQGITGQHDMFAEKPANIPMPNKIKPIRFEAGKTLTKEQRKEVLRNISDAYRVNGVEKREVVIQTHGGTEDEVVYRYPYTPSAFEKSDITGKMVRYYIFLPDGKKAHPSELFPELTEAQIQRELDRQRYEEEKAKKDEAYEVDAKMSRVAPPSDNQMQEANKAYIKTGRHSSYSFFAKDKEGNLVRVDGSDAKDIAFYKAREFRPTAPANGLREEEVEEYKRKAMKDFPPPAFKDANNPMGLEQKPEAPATPESHFDGLKRSLVNSTSENHVVIYNRQYVDMGYVEDPKEQFKMAAMRVYDNLGTGKDATDTGYIRTPQGEFFKVTRANKTAVKVSPDEILGTAKEKPETPTAKGEAGTISPATAKTLLSLPGEQRRYPSGDHLSSLRQQIIAELTGEKVPKSKADAMAVESALKKASGIEHGTFQEYLNWLKGIAESDSPAFMARPALPGDRIPGAEVMRAVDAVASKFNVSVKVVPTAADLPEGIRDAAMRRQAGGYVVLGIYHGGKVYIVAEHMRSRMEAQKVFIHEAVGHYGLRKVMGKDFEDFLDFIVNDTKYGTEINAFAEKNGIDDPRVSADEWFAQQSETARPSLWNRFMMAVKAFLARLGVKWEFSKTELTELLRKAREAAVKGGPVKGGGTRYQVEAWHGSPHQVDKFSSDKIGSGEGAQAFGWGLYFTDKKEIGKIYAESTAEQQKTILIDGEDVPSELKYEAKFLANRLYADLHDYVKPNYRARAISTLESEISFSKLKGYTNSIKEKEKLLKLIKASKGIEINRSRNLYKVTLHKGKDPSEYNYLEWEKKVTDTQKDLIRKQLIKEPSANKDVENLFTKFNPQPDINEQLGIDIHGKELYDLLENKLGSDKEASLFLLRAGIDGIKYPAGTLSGVKSDAYNYVVFDENAVTIDEATRFATRPASQGIELPEETRMQWFQRMVQDKLNRLEQVQGKTPVISEATDAYMKSELFIGKATERVKEFDKEIVSGKDSFLSKLTDSGFTISELDMLLYAEHAKERNAYIATINKKLPEAGSGMSDDDANAIIDAADPALVQFAKEFRNKVTRAALQLRLDEGLITQETYDTLDSFYQNYVPLKGKAGKESYRRIGKGFSVTGKDIIRARGRSSMADSPVTQAIMDMDDAIVRAEKNKVMLALRQLVLDNPGEFWHVEKLQYLPKYDKDGNIEYMDPRYKYDPEAIEVKVEGKTEYVMIQDKALVEGLKNMGAGQGIKILSTVNNYLRAVNTIYSPEFIITNFERDIQTAIINIGGEKSAKIARKMVKDVPAAMQGIYRNVRDKKPNAWADLYEEFKETGGRIGWMDMDSIEQRSNKLEKQVRDFKNPNGLRQTVKAVGEYMDNMNEAVESGVRLSAYKQLRDAGVSKEKAAQYAKNLTVNFNKKGQWGTILNILYLFSNASIQGSARMLGALKKPRVQAIVGSILTSSVLMGLLNRWRDEDSWDQVPGYTKDTNWLVPLTDGKYIAFRVPYGYNIFHVLGNVTEETIFGNLSLPEAAGRVMNGMLNAFNPLGGASLFQMLSPTIIDPLAMAVENKNFMGTQLHPEQAPYQPYAPASSLFTKGNREGSVFFSQWLNRITGGNETLSGKVDIYPAYFDLILDTIGGGVSRSTADLIQSGVTLAKGDIPDLNHIPIARQFVKTPSQSTAKSVVYDMAKEAERHIFSENQMARFYYSLRLAEENGSMSREQIRKVRRGFEKSQKTAIKSRGGYSPLQQPTSEPEPEPVKHRPMTLQDMIR